MSRYSSLFAGTLLVLGGCTKAPVEPTRDELLPTVSECANNACKDFKKIDCQKAGDPDGMNGALFKCRYSYALASSATAEPKTGEKCVVNEGKGWRVGAAC